MLVESIRIENDLDSEIRKRLLALASRNHRDSVCMVLVPKVPRCPGSGVTNSGRIEVPVLSTIAPGVPAVTIWPSPRNVQLDVVPAPVNRLNPPGSAVAVEVGAPCTSDVSVHCGSTNREYGLCEPKYVPLAPFH